MPTLGTKVTVNFKVVDDLRVSDIALIADDNGMVTCWLERGRTCEEYASALGPMFTALGAAYQRQMMTA